MENLDDFAADITTTGVLIADGTAAVGNVDFSGDEDWFALEVIQGDIYNINFTSSLTGPDIAYHDSDGSFLLDGSFPNTDLSFTALTTGTVYISASLFGDATGSYELTANNITPNVLEDDFTDNVTTTGVLIADGAATVGNIEVSNDKDWFAIEVIAGETYTVNITSDTITSSALDLNLFDSSGIFLNGVIASQPLTFTASETGTFFIEADVFGSQSGAYELTANVVEDDFAANVTTTGVLSADGTATVGNIDFAGDEDWFALEVTQGELYNINFVSSLTSADIDLYDSNGTFLQDGSDVLSFTAQTTGTVYISADVFGSVTGSYELTANILEDDFSDDVNTTGVLSADGTATVGNLDFAGDEDWFALEVIQGELYNINFVSSLTGADIELHDSNGSFLQDGSDVLSFTAQTTGTVFISADVFGSATGSYELTANVVEDDFAADVTTTGVLSADGTAVVGNIEVAGDSDWFALEVIVGEQYIIDLTGITISEFDFDLSLFDGSGAVLSNVFGADPLVFTASETGTVFIGANAQPFSSTGEYNLTANIFEDDFAGDVTTTGVLSADGTAAVGNIEVAGDADWFALEVIAGEQYIIVLTGITVSEFDFDLSLFDGGSGAVLTNVFFGADSFVFTASETGTVFVGANAQPFSSTGEYNLTANILVDDFSDDLTTTGVLLSEAGSASSGSIDFAGDEDWFALEVTAGETYTVNITSDTISAFNLDLNLFDSSGLLLNGVIGSQPLTFTAAETGTFYVEADVFGAELGDYQLTAGLAEAPVDDFAGDVTTTGLLTSDGVASTGALEVNGDDDWFELTITEAQTLQINLTGVSLSDPFLYLYDSNGSLLAANDDSDGLDSQLTFNFDAGTYYVSARAYADSGSGTYELTAQEIQPPSPTDAIDWGTYLPGAGDGTTQINVYFVPGAQNINVEEFGISVDTLEFTQYEIDQFNLAFDEIESIIDVEFVVVTDPDQADFTLALNTDDPGLLGFMFPQGETENDDGLGVFNRDGIGWDEEGGGGLEQGGFGYVTIVHELGHGLGLAHPHDNGGGSTILPGVSGFGAQTDTGDFDLNQSVFTILSYVDGWALNPAGSPGTFDQGYQATFAPLDIAVLQAAYGANTTTNQGDTVYELVDINQSGTAFEAIFDNGGTDTILSASDSDTVINLNDATLQLEFGGGGFISNVAGIHGGYTIANGTVIENATSGSGNDLLIGNQADNVLDASLGDDVLNGEAGDDILYGGAGNDNLAGEAGDDTLNGGNDNDIVDGGNGEDVIDGGAGNDTLRGGGNDDIIGGGAGLDTISAGIGNDTVHGGGNNDTILGQGGADILYGDGGADTLRGGSGNDTLYGGAASDQLFGQGNNDILYGEGGNDNLSGAAGSDQLFGGDGDDTLNGSIGADRLDGGAGNDILNGGGADGARDTFVFAEGYDQDRINGFDQAGNDRLELDDALWAAAGTLTSQEVVDMFGSLNGTGSILTLDFGNGDILEVQNGAGIDMDTFGADILVI